MKLGDFLITREWYPKTGTFFIVQNESDKFINVLYQQNEYVLHGCNVLWTKEQSNPIHTYHPHQVFSIPEDAMRNEFGNYNLELPISILREVRIHA